MHKNRCFTPALTATVQDLLITHCNHSLMRFAGFVLVASLVGLPGCSRAGELDRVAVHGQVVVDGQPLEAGTIVFVPVGDTKGPKSAGEIREGRYSIPRERGPVVGNLRVEIRAAPMPSADISEPEEFVRQLNQPSSLWPPEPIPARYNDDSGLRVTTTAGKNNRFDFRLQRSPTKGDGS